MIDAIAKQIEDDVTINFTSEGSVRITRKVKGVNKTNLITFDELIDCILASKAQVQFDSDASGRVINYDKTEILPANRSVYTITVKESKEMNARIYVMIRPAKPTVVKYNETVWPEINIPTLAFAVKVINDIPTKAWVVALKGDGYNIKKEEPIYRFPLSNVFSDSVICYGGNRLTEVTIGKDSEVARLVGMFLDMPYNIHNYTGANKSGLEFRKLMEKIIEEKKFNEEWLIPSQIHGVKTLEDWINFLG